MLTFDVLSFILVKKIVCGHQVKQSFRSMEIYKSLKVVLFKSTTKKIISLAAVLFGITIELGNFAANS